MGEKTGEDGVTYVAPDRGKSVWIGDRELVTFKQTGTDMSGLFAMDEGGQQTYTFCFRCLTE